MIIAFDENPFCILEASPTDDRRSLIDRADEASLLGADNAPDALDALLNSQRRLDAEINWFPQTDSASVQAVLSYPAAGCAPYPDVRTTSALAVFNACRAMLETWKMKDDDRALALCKTFAAVDARMTASSVMEQLNADRQKAGMQLLTSTGDVSYRLDQLRHDMAKVLLERISKEANVTPVMSELLTKLAHEYKNTPSQLLEAMIGIYELDNAEKASALYKEVLGLTQAVITQSTKVICQTKANQIEKLLGQWAKLTAPMRKLQAAKGIAGDESRKLFHDIREFAVRIQNEQFQMNECYALLRALKSTFWDDLPEAAAVIDNDIKTLDNLKAQLIAKAFRQS